ncbi:YidH family protein [Glycomyces terrestris]|uniref:DUF202 domain-containing protein n=1 Tax=Glycomyces terrestris TaxID=2493553 RepID=A0A426UW87_9ACTN|nr:DUF202 domain-containing protein [Glycomyces terrestris]RRR98478.1 DUF202 domain-containing protein [Glycomyces terrestris]
MRTAHTPTAGGGRGTPHDDRDPERRPGSGAEQKPHTGRRFPKSVYEHGEEPDPRFSLANERTFLASIRTALAFIAGGIALQALATALPGPIRLSAALILIAVGVALPAQAWRTWTRTERAIRTGQPLPAPSLALPIAVAVALVAVLVAAGLAAGPVL